MKTNNKKTNWKEIVFIGAIILIFISPAIVIGSGPLFLYIIMSAVFGLSISIDILSYFKNKLKAGRRYNLFLTNKAIVLYLFLYVILSVFRDIRFIGAIPPLAVLKIILCSYFLFFNGLRGLRSGQMRMRTGIPLSKTNSHILGVVEILMALLALIFI